MVQQQMVKISVEVRSGAARFRVGVQARSIHKALSLVGGMYPRGVVGVAFPVEPQGIFERGTSAPAGVVGHGHTRRAAA
jgi:hypothetical protein